ncbi:hypothetical protein [Sphingomonas quercus]|uniref:Uncharacterized protein n=1 Tax=Sphingomonas quercus TaxID=2842451 RepID=A0ABS6BDC0_9SPHN|nr:hypothetical protein [Sphingomonas quercus]MBU3076303.1 hypothetical protein [Sphingomonas quercus]
MPRHMLLIGAGLIATAMSAPAFSQTAPQAPGGTTYPTRPGDTSMSGSAATSADQPMAPDTSGTRITADGNRSPDPNNANGPVAASDPKAKTGKSKQKPQ